MSVASSAATDEVGISFVPQDATIHFGDATENKSGRSITMSIVLDSHEDVRLPDKRTLKQSRWGLYLIEGLAYNDWTTERGAIGIVSTSDKFEAKNTTPALPAECYINAAIKPETFSTLLVALQSGRLPSKVHIQARGMEYGWEPDGEGKVWDLKSTPTAPLVEMKFDIPLIASIASPSESVAHTNGGSLPVTANDVKVLERRLLENLTSIQRQMAKRWTILFVLLAIAVVLLYLRR